MSDRICDALNLGKNAGNLLHHFVHGLGELIKLVLNACNGHSNIELARRYFARCDLKILYPS